MYEALALRASSFFFKFVTFRRTPWDFLALLILRRIDIYYGTILYELYTYLIHFLAI